MSVHDTMIKMISHSRAVAHTAVQVCRGNLKTKRNILLYRRVILILSKARIANRTPAIYLVVNILFHYVLTAIKFVCEM